MPLTGKYLKYSPEITLEIFTLVYKKLMKLGWAPNDIKPITSLYIEFNRSFPYLLDLGYSGLKLFGTFTSPRRDDIETTVQEILGYNPFKDFQKYVLKSTEQLKVMEKDWTKATEDELLEEAKQPLKTKEIILDENHIGKLVSLTYSGRLYDEVLVTKENGQIYLLNNVQSNNNGHSDKSVYKYSLCFGNLSQANQYCSNFKLLEKTNIIEDDLSSLSITELHEKGLVKRFFEEVVKVNFSELPDGKLCSYENFSGKSCAGLKCNNCYLKGERRDELKSLLEIKEQSVVKPNQEFRVGDWIVLGGGWSFGSYDEGDLFQVHSLEKYTFSARIKGSTEIKNGFSYTKNRLATPEEINNHLTGIEQVPTFITNLQMGITVKKPFYGATGFPTTGNCYNEGFSTSIIKVEPKLILSIEDDEELPMANIIKTNTVKQLLNLD